MKKRHFFVLSAILPALALPIFTACAPYDYSDRISEVRSDLFLAETDDFSLTIACLTREYPYADDGIPCPMTSLIEADLHPKTQMPDTVEIYAEGINWGGEASFSAVSGSYRFSQGTDTFPEGSISLRVVWGDSETTIAATSVRTEETLSAKEALSVFVEAEKETLARMKQDGAFCGELCVRLLRRDKNYYYAAVTDGKERTALLIDAETGEILARRTDTL